MGYTETAATPILYGPNDRPLERTRPAIPWVEYQHPDHKRLAPHWEYTDDTYTGRVIDEDVIVNYLQRRSQGESVEQYNERAKLADYPNLFATIIEGLAGMLSHSEEDANRVLNDTTRSGEPVRILGSRKERDSLFARLLDNADGQGTGYLTVFQQLSIELLKFHCAWGLVDRVEDGDPTIRFLPPACVPNWIARSIGGPKVALFREEMDTRESLEEDPEAYRRVRYIRYALDGWQRFEVNPAREVVALAGEENAGTYEYYARDGRTRILPIFPVKLHMKREIGYLTARRCISYFNQKSARDWNLRSATGPKLELEAPSEREFDTMLAKLARGFTAIHRLPNSDGARYLEAPTAGATALTEVLREDARDIFFNAFREYGDSADGPAGEAKTATEVRSNVGAGPAACLQLLTATLDDAENEGMIRITQTEFPKDRKKWFVPHVVRSREFLPPDPGAVMDAMMARVFGKDAVAPLGNAARVKAAMELAEYQGLEANEAEIKAEVQLRSVLEILQAAAAAKVPLGETMLVELSVRLAAASGFIDPEKTMAMADGSQVKMLEVIRTEAAAIAALERQRAELEAQPLGGPDAGGGAGGEGE